MKNLSNYINFALLALGAILSSNTDGSVKTIGIIVLFFTVSRIPSTKLCFTKLKKQDK